MKQNFILDHTDKVVKFLVYCVEIYKTAYGLNGKQVMQLFSRYGISDYIINYYGALHTTGPEYIIKDIAGLIEERLHNEELDSH